VRPLHIAGLAAAFPGHVAGMADVIDHVAIRVSDLAASRRFYEAVLGPLGMNALDTVDAASAQGEGVAFGRPGADDFWIHAPKGEPGRDRPTTGLHLAFRAADADQVRAFHAAGVASGGRDIGAPGPRPEYSEGYYGAFLLDPDGNNVEAVWHAGRPLTT
jgi:catechol 2,3-dioxygenase-like lactoylglutathione lyase family enzyme